MSDKCNFRRTHVWRLKGGKAGGAYLNAHERCTKCEEEQEPCIRDTFKEQTGKSDTDFSTTNIFINLKQRGVIEQKPQPDQENQQEVMEAEAPAE